MRYLPAIAVLALISITNATDPNQITGNVVRVVDGNTLVVEAVGDRQRVRLAAIDAPGRNQPWGQASTRELRRQVAGQEVVIEGVEESVTTNLKTDF